MVRLLLSRIFDFLSDESEAHHNMTWLVLSQLRWMDTPVEEESLTEKLSELVTVLKDGLLHETVLLLPEILSSSSHHLMVSPLLEVLITHK